MRPSLTPEYHKAYNAKYYRLNRRELLLKAQNKKAFGDYLGPLVGHCNSWWPVNSVPFEVPCCGAVLFKGLTK